MVGEAPDFSVSYTQADRAWAEWITWQLNNAGQRIVLQAWDFGPGSDWVHQMHNAAATAKRTIAVLSGPVCSRYSVYGEAGWRAAWAKDPRESRVCWCRCGSSPSNYPGCWQPATILTSWG
jgi:TIR domain-containing protein